MSLKISNNLVNLVLVLTCFWNLIDTTLNKALIPVIVPIVSGILSYTVDMNMYKGNGDPSDNEYYKTAYGSKKKVSYGYIECSPYRICL